MEEVQMTWQKIENEVKKIGLGDGLSSGQNSNFQEYFDKGFSEGFQNAYAIGQHKGTLFARCTQQNNSLQESELLKQPKLAWCQVCVKKHLLSENVSSLIKHQRELCDKKLQELNGLYSNKE